MSPGGIAKRFLKQGSVRGVPLDGPPLGDPIRRQPPPPSPRAPHADPPNHVARKRDRFCPVRAKTRLFVTILHVNAGPSSELDEFYCVPHRIVLNLGGGWLLPARICPRSHLSWSTDRGDAERVVKRELSKKGSSLGHPQEGLEAPGTRRFVAPHSFRIAWVR